MIGTNNVIIIVPNTADMPPIPETAPTFFPLKKSEGSVCNLLIKN